MSFAEMKALHSKFETDESFRSHLKRGKEGLFRLLKTNKLKCADRDRANFIQLIAATLLRTAAGADAEQWQKDFGIGPWRFYSNQVVPFQAELPLEIIRSWQRIPSVHEKVQLMGTMARPMENAPINLNNIVPMGRAEDDAGLRMVPMESDDFRTVSVYPDSLDLSEDPDLERNIVKGAYKDGFEHYLNVQYWLLREDFMRPLRNGISQCRESKSNSAGNSNVYRNTHITSTKMTAKGQLLTCVFDT